MAKKFPNFPHYENLTEFLAACDAPREWPRVQTSRDKSNGTWAGTPDYDTAAALMRDGYKKGRDMLSRDLAQAGKITGLAHRSQILDVAGAYPIVPIWIAGDAACMVNIGEEERATKPVVRFSVSVSVSGGISPEVMSRRGAAILSWIDALEDTGTRCEISVQFATSLGGGYGFSLMLKNADEHLDLDKVAYPLIHPSMLRRHVFAWSERNIPAQHEDIGYGRPRDIPETEQGAIVFGNMTYGTGPWATVESAVAHVKEQIKAGGYMPDDDTQEAA